VPRYLLTIHDLEASMGPGWTTRFIHRWGLRRATGRNLRLIATSAKARDALDMLSPRLRESIWMIHSGPGNVRAFPASARASASVAHKRWFLTTSEGGRAENMNFLIAAMALWYRKRPDAPRLIWAGDASSEMQDRWTRIPARARHHIRVMPVESEEMRDQLFGEAIALIIPDLEPAHAYDALEAMSRGVPVMCARRRPFTDLLGQAPLWFDPRDSSTLWRALDALLDDATLRPEVVRRGLREAARYDWRDTAEMTLGAYRQLMRTFPGS
jgi:glycosyltransferase involved in cell wall biosynthesis